LDGLFIGAAGILTSYLIFRIPDALGFYRYGTGVGQWDCMVGGRAGGVLPEVGRLHTTFNLIHYCTARRTSLICHLPGSGVLISSTGDKITAEIIDYQLVITG